jgi:hypothetical protein
MSDTAEQRLAALLRVLRPAPASWVKAASEIPQTKRELEQPEALTPPSAPAADTPEAIGVEQPSRPHASGSGSSDD